MKMQRRLGLAAGTLALALLVTVGSVRASSPTRNYRAVLAGDQGRGVATFQVSQDGTSVRYKLEAANLSSLATMAHIHVGTAGQNGPVIVWLFPDAPPASPGVEARGRLAEGEITAGQLLGSYAGRWEAFKQDLMGGKLYVNVHTVTNPAGEIRGQVDGRGHGADDARGDDRGGRHEPEPGDDRGGHHESEPGDDRGGRR